MLIVLNGYARSGKDAVADRLVDRHGYTKVRFSDAICASLYALDPLIPIPSDDGLVPLGHVRVSELVDAIGWEQAKDEYPEVRRLLQRQGHEATKEVLADPELWLRPVLRSLGKVVVTGCRFRGEADAAVRAGAVLVRVNRAGGRPVNGHAGETEMDDYPFEYVIANDGTLADLHAKADMLAAFLEARS